MDAGLSALVLAMLAVAAVVWFVLDRLGGAGEERLARAAPREAQAVTARPGVVASNVGRAVRDDGVLRSNAAPRHRSDEDAEPRRSLALMLVGGADMALGLMVLWAGYAYWLEVEAQRRATLPLIGMQLGTLSRLAKSLGEALGVSALGEFEARYMARQQTAFTFIAIGIVSAIVGLILLSHAIVQPDPPAWGTVLGLAPALIALFMLATSDVGVLRGWLR